MVLQRWDSLFLVNKRYLIFGLKIDNKSGKQIKRYIVSILNGWMLWCDAAPVSGEKLEEQSDTYVHWTSWDEKKMERIDENRTQGTLLIRDINNNYKLSNMLIKSIIREEFFFIILLVFVLLLLLYLNWLGFIHCNFKHWPYIWIKETVRTDPVGDHFQLDVVKRGAMALRHSVFFFLLWWHFQKFFI